MESHPGEAAVKPRPLVRKRRATLRIFAFVPIDLQMETMEKAMQHRREQNADHRYERDPAEERVEPREQVEMG